MTQEIIDMARQAGATPSSNPDEYDVMKITDRGLEAFAKLIEESATVKEREACAKLCDRQQEMVGGEMCCVAMNCAEAIRARGQA